MNQEPDTHAKLEADMRSFNSADENYDAWADRVEALGKRSAPALTQEQREALWAALDTLAHAETEYRNVGMYANERAAEAKRLYGYHAATIRAMLSKEPT